MKNEKPIKNYSIEELRDMVARGEDRTDSARIEAMSNADLDQAIADDPDWQEVPRDWHHEVEAVMPRPKVPITIRIDADIAEFFREQGRGWQTRMNAVLRAYANTQRSAKVR